MTKAQIKNYLVDTAVDEMTKYYNISIGDALDVIYNSETFQKMGDADTGLYTQSPLYIYELLNREYQTGRLMPI